MRVLVVGAGVIGSFNAARLAAAGVDVRLLARGQRLAALREHGVILQDWRTGRRSVTRVALVESIEPAARYDVAVVIVRRNQVASVLALLAAARASLRAFFSGTIWRGRRIWRRLWVVIGY